MGVDFECEKHRGEEGGHIPCCGQVFAARTLPCIFRAAIFDKMRRRTLKLYELVFSCDQVKWVCMLERKRTERDKREEGYVLFAVKFFVSYPCSIML
jgi:hypothetical protein